MVSTVELGLKFRCCSCCSSSFLCTLPSCCLHGHRGSAHRVCASLLSGAVGGPTASVVILTHFFGGVLYFSPLVFVGGCVVLMFDRRHAS